MARLADVVAPIAHTDWREHVALDTTAHWRIEWQLRRWDDARDAHHRYHPWVMERRYVHDRPCEECGAHQGDWETYVLADSPEQAIDDALMESSCQQAIGDDPRFDARRKRWQARRRMVQAQECLARWITQRGNDVRRQANALFQQRIARVRRPERKDAIKTEMLAEWRPRIEAHDALVARVQAKYALLAKRLEAEA